MTLPVSLAETPALPRVAETATVASGASEGGAAFAETLAGAMGPVAAGAVAPSKAVGSEAAPAVVAPDAEAMLADLGQRAIAVEGKVATLSPLLPGAGMAVSAEASVAAVAAGAVVPSTEVAPEAATLVPSPEPALEGAAVVPTSETIPGPLVTEDVVAEEAATPDLPAFDLPGETPPSGDEDGTPDGETPPPEEVPIDLSLATLLAVALPPGSDTTGEAPPVATQDAAVEAAQRAMAAAITLPGLARLDKPVKGPLEAPEMPEPFSEAPTETAEEAEVVPTKAPASNDLRPAPVTPTPVAADARSPAEARREAVTEIVAAVSGETAEVSGSTTSTSTTATTQAGAQAMPLVAGGPIQTGRPGWEAALADRIAAELSGDGKEIELELAPEKLGHLKIRLEVVDGLAQVRIVTETPEAARLFQQNEHRLSENLSRAGLSLGGQDTMSRDAQSGNAQGQNGQGQGPADRGGRPRGMEMHFDRQGTGVLAELAGRAPRGLVNLIA